jgi:hypothetical protein
VEFLIKERNSNEASKVKDAEKTEKLEPKVDFNIVKQPQPTPVDDYEPIVLSKPVPVIEEPKKPFMIEELD